MKNSAEPVFSSLKNIADNKPISIEIEAIKMKIFFLLFDFSFIFFKKGRNIKYCINNEIANRIGINKVKKES